jgi:hypothetical protein
MGKSKGGNDGGGPTPPPINPASQELLEAVQALAYGVTGLAESLPVYAERVEVLIERLEVVSQQFAVLIAAEAERRNVSADNLVKGMLMNLGRSVFRSGRRGKGGGG